VGKTAFAQELAENLGMKYFPHVSMDDVYINSYGDDLRNYNHLLTQFNQTWDEKDFARDPMGGHDGAIDRLHAKIYYLKFNQYLAALRHLMNTGQGCVLERTAYTDYAYFNAAYNQGWIHRSTRAFYESMLSGSLFELLRPNLIIYLDASVDTVQKKIAARGNEWDKNSPVYGNASYLNDIYNTIKKDYLSKEKLSSQILVYDWSEPGEVESVVEDIEALNFDQYGRYEMQQRDWRWGLEEVAAGLRGKYSTAFHLNYMRTNCLNPNYYEGEKLFVSTPDTKNLEEVESLMKGGTYAAGYNIDEGDSMANIFFKWGTWDQTHRDGRLGNVPAGMQLNVHHPSREELEKRRLENETTEVGKFL